MDVTSGMFNNKPVTDIESFVQLGDGKVVTGCEWGNLLLWEKGKVGEICFGTKVENCIFPGEGGGAEKGPLHLP